MTNTTTTNVARLLGTIRHELLHQVDEAGPFKIMDVMTVSDIEATLPVVNMKNLLELITQVNKSLI